MDTIFINSESTKMPEPHDLRRGEKSIALSNLSIHYMWKNIKRFIQQQYEFNNNNIQ